MNLFDEDDKINAIANNLWTQRSREGDIKNALEQSTVSVNALSQLAKGKDLILRAYEIQVVKTIESFLTWALENKKEKKVREETLL